MGIFASDNRTVLCPSLLISGPDQCGKNHLLSYYGLDHPKSKTTKIIPGAGSDFFNRYQWFSHSDIVPDNLSVENQQKFIRQLEKPVISIGQGISGSGAYPFLEYHIDFRLDSDMILRFMVQSKVTTIVKKCSKNNFRGDPEMAISSLSDSISTFFKEIIDRTSHLKFSRLQWVKILPIMLIDLVVFYIDRKSF